MPRFLRQITVSTHERVHRYLLPLVYQPRQASAHAPLVPTIRPATSTRAAMPAREKTVVKKSDAPAVIICDVVPMPRRDTARAGYCDNQLACVWPGITPLDIAMKARIDGIEGTAGHR